MPFIIDFTAIFIGYENSSWTTSDLKSLSSCIFEIEANQIYSSFYFNRLDIDECSGTNDCDSNAQCTDTDGSYTCMCNDGYTGNGTSCDGKFRFIDIFWNVIVGSNF